MALSVPISAAGQPVDPKPPPSPSAQQSPSIPQDQDFVPPRVTESPGATAALEKIRSRIKDHVKKGNKHTFASYVDPDGKIVLATDAPESVVSSLTNLPATAPVAEKQAASQLQVRRSGVSNGAGRRDDVAPFYGGAGISAGAGACSSGYTVKSSLGHRYMVTAGHCFPHGHFVYTESGRALVGQVCCRALDRTRDMEILHGQSYGAYIYVGNEYSSYSLPVKGAGNAAVLFRNYCRSGRTTGEHCGLTAVSTNAEICTETGCISPVIAFTGGNVGDRGDSGAPFYARSTDNSAAYIRGHYIAFLNDRSQGFAERWDKVASTYGVSIQTAP